MLHFKPPMPKSPKQPEVKAPAGIPMPAKTREEIRDAVMLLASDNRLSLKSVIEAIQPDLAPEEEKQLASQVAQWFSELITKLKPATETAPAMKIVPIQLEECLVPPSDQEITIRNNKAKPDQAEILPIHPRTHMAIGVMQSLGATDLQLFTGKNDPDIVRKLSYNALVSKQLEKLVLVCDEDRNRTFVVHTAKSPEHFWKMSKAELKTLTESGKASDLSWSNPEEWSQTFRLLMTSNPGMNRSKSTREQAYFLDPQNIRADLEKMAKKIGCKIERLTAHNICPIQIQCSSGENITGNKYLRRAGVAIGLATNQTETSERETLDCLKRAIGIQIPERKTYPPMDKAYFEDSNKVRADLESIATKRGCLVEKLTTGKFNNCRFLCSNGEETLGYTYLIRASTAIKTEKQPSRAKGKHKRKIQMVLTLDHLKRAIGIQVPERKTYPPMDKAYFKDARNIKADLEAVAAKLKCQIKELAMGGNITVQFSNGEMLYFYSYLYRAATGTGLTTNQTRENRFPLSLVLDHLKRAIGIQVPERKTYPPMDKAYFDDARNIKADLESAAAKLNCSVEELNSKMEYCRFLCSNGEETLGIKYFRRAAVGMDMVELQVSAGSMIGRILDQLKRKIGLNVPERPLEQKTYPAMDKDYFANSENIKKDLGSYATKIGCSVEDLTAHKFLSMKKIPCSNGEGVNGNTYLQRASIVFGMKGQLAPTLDELRLKIGTKAPTK